MPVVVVVHVNVMQAGTYVDIWYVSTIVKLTLDSWQSEHSWHEGRLSEAFSGLRNQHVLRGHIFQVDKRYKDIWCRQHISASMISDWDWSSLIKMVETGSRATRAFRDATIVRFPCITFAWLGIIVFMVIMILSTSLSPGSKASNWQKAQKSWRRFWTSGELIKSCFFSRNPMLISIWAFRCIHLCFNVFTSVKSANHHWLTDSHHFWSVLWC